MKPAPLAPPLTGEVQDAALLCRRLPEWSTSKDLKIYFRSRLDLDIEKVTYSFQPNIALVQFLTPVGKFSNLFVMS